MVLMSIVVNWARAFRIGSGSSLVRAWILKNFRASIGPDPGAKSKFSVSDRVFIIAAIKQREHLV